MQKKLIFKSIYLALFAGLSTTQAMADTFDINDGTQSEITIPNGNNVINIQDGSVLDVLYTGNGDNLINVTGGQITGAIDSSFQTEGGNYIQLSGGTVNFVHGSEANDTIILDGSSMPGEGGLYSSGAIYGNAGDNNIIIKSGDVVDVIGGSGNDKVDIWGGTISGVVFGGQGNDIIAIHGDNAVINSLDGDFIDDPGESVDDDDKFLYRDTIILSGVTDAISLNPLLLKGESFENITLNDATNITLSNDLWTGKEFTTSALFLDSTSTLNIVGSQTVYGNVTNAGVMSLNNGVPGNSLHISGDYAGNDGTLQLATKLGGDDSSTDKVTIDGDTSGKTFVAVTNAGGSGAQTLNGIELISVGGVSDGEFKQKGRIVAGAYDYTLVRGTENAKNWYLTSTDTTPPIIDPVDPVDPVNNVRPEAAAYAVNSAASNTLFTTSLHDRLGETNYVDALTGERLVTSLWMRNEGGHNRSTDSSGQNNTHANRYVLQLGGDVAQWSTDGTNRYHIGMMGGYANQKAKTSNNRTGYHADSSIDGYSAGLYGSWFQDNETRSGAYLDSWMLYNWFDNNISGQDNPTESYKSKGITASVEAGYAWKLTDLSQRNAWFVQPQAQITYMGVKSDDHQEANGTYVKSEGDGNIQSRLGVRTYLKGHSKIDDNKNRTFEPFVEANWIHNTKSFGASLDGVRIDQAGARNIGELKTGVEAKLSKNVNFWGSVAQQIGDKGYSDTEGVVGVKVSF